MKPISLPSIPTINYPFPWKENPHLAEVEKLVNQWIDRYDFLPEDVREKCKKSRFTTMCAWFWPNVSKEVFVPINRWIVWIFIYDDYYSTHSINQILASKRHFIEILQGRALTVEDNESSRQLAIVRDECLACGATPDWMQRFIKSLELYFDGTIMERAYNYQESLRYPSIEEYITLRRKTVAIYPTIDFMELGIDFILPIEVATHPFVQKLRDLSSDLIALCNDLYSLKKELYRNEASNWVLVIQHERGCSLQEACEEAIRIHETKLEEFLCLISFPSDFGSSEINEEMKRYISNVKLMMPGNLIWSQRSKRFNDESAFF